MNKKNKSKPSLLNLINTWKNYERRQNLIEKACDSKSDRLYLSCDCSCSILTVEKNKEDNLYYIGLFKRGFNNILSWKERFRWAKEILLTGNVWTDNVVLNKKEYNKLKKFMDKN